MTDPDALLSSSSSIVIVAVVACVVPIRRAMTLDPVVALRA